ncbi:MAG: hypothetical protein HYS12_06940 [Planctomycetes bacterium]|nr:hypothetical protein [Planctomycetota bacterium]
MIGGTDLICPVRSDIPISDVIFRVVRRHWPRYVFQNADESGPFTPHAGPWLPRPSGREFFVYRDEESARSWEEHGAIPEILGTMLYVILPAERSLLVPVATSVTLVCGELTGETGEVVQEIQGTFRDSIESLSSCFVPFPLEAA